MLDVAVVAMIQEASEILGNGTHGEYNQLLGLGTGFISVCSSPIGGFAGIAGTPPHMIVSTMFL